MARGITKDDIVQDFAVLHGINQETARLYFDSFATLIAEGLNTNGKVHIKYLGTFQKKTVPARKLYNFHTKEPVDVPEHGGIRFIPSECLLNMNGKNQILEICQVSGRRRIKIVLHEIYADNSKYNENGITWLEQYTRDNADTIKGMPLCAEFIDNDKDIPYGHGLTGLKGNIPVFENSVQVGTFEDWTIENVDFEGEKHKCLCGIGYINENRYPNFCDWIDKQIAERNKIFGSVETTGTPENNGEIIYQDGWKEKGRVPMIYDYTGYCIVTVRPSDDKAILLEFQEGTKVEAEAEEKNNYDDVFLDLLGERNAANTSEFDDIFGKSEPYNHGKNEFDEIFQ